MESSDQAVFYRAARGEYRSDCIPLQTASTQKRLSAPDEVGSGRHLNRAVHCAVERNGRLRRCSDHPRGHPICGAFETSPSAAGFDKLGGGQGRDASRSAYEAPRPGFEPLLYARVVRGWDKLPAPAAGQALAHHTDVGASAVASTTALVARRRRRGSAQHVDVKHSMRESIGAASSPSHNGAARLKLAARKSTASLFEAAAADAVSGGGSLRYMGVAAPDCLRVDHEVHQHADYGGVGVTYSPPISAPKGRWRKAKWMAPRTASEDAGEHLRCAWSVNELWEDYLADAPNAAVAEWRGMSSAVDVDNAVGPMLVQIWWVDFDAETEQYALQWEQTSRAFFFHTPLGAPSGSPERDREREREDDGSDSSFGVGSPQKLNFTGHSGNFDGNTGSPSKRLGRSRTVLAPPSLSEREPAVFKFHSNIAWMLGSYRGCVLEIRYAQIELEVQKEWMLGQNFVDFQTLHSRVLWNSKDKVKILHRIVSSFLQLLAGKREEHDQQGSTARDRGTRDRRLRGSSRNLAHLTDELRDCVVAASYDSFMVAVINPGGVHSDAFQTTVAMLDEAELANCGIAALGTFFDGEVRDAKRFVDAREGVGAPFFWPEIKDRRQKQEAAAGNGRPGGATSAGASLTDPIILPSGRHLLMVRVEAGVEELSDADAIAWIERDEVSATIRCPHNYAKGTTLHIAAASGRVAIVKALLEWPGCDLLAQDVHGQTAPDVATGNCSSYLKSRGRIEQVTVGVGSAVTGILSIPFGLLSGVPSGVFSVLRFIVCCGRKRKPKEGRRGSTVAPAPNATLRATGSAAKYMVPGSGRSAGVQHVTSKKMVGPSVQRASLKGGAIKPKFLMDSDIV